MGRQKQQKNQKQIVKKCEPKIDYEHIFQTAPPVLEEGAWDLDKDKKKKKTRAKSEPGEKRVRRPKNAGEKRPRKKKETAPPQLEPYKFDSALPLDVSDVSVQRKLMSMPSLTKLDSQEMAQIARVGHATCSASGNSVLQSLLKKKVAPRKAKKPTDGAGPSNSKSLIRAPKLSLNGRMPVLELQKMPMNPSEGVYIFPPTAWNNNFSENPISFYTTPSVSKMGLENSSIIVKPVPKTISSCSTFPQATPTSFAEIKKLEPKLEPEESSEEMAFRPSALSQMQSYAQMVNLNSAETIRSVNMQNSIMKNNYSVAKYVSQKTKMATAQGIVPVAVDEKMGTCTVTTQVRDAAPFQQRQFAVINSQNSVCAF